MVYEDYICETCGFTSQEKRGSYKCPVCGNLMKVHEGQYGGKLTIGAGNLLIYFIECIVVFPICFVFLNIPGIIVFIIILLLTRRFLNKRTRNNAIKIIPNNIKNPNKIYTCSSCKNNFKGQQLNCPYCGIKLTYND